MGVRGRHGFERWVDYALDVPMYFIKRGDTYIDVAGSSFRDFFAGKNGAFPGERPTLSDWANHLSTISRGAAEALPGNARRRRRSLGRLPALPAFWTGLLYDDTSLDAAWDIVKHWNAGERQALRDDVPRFGFKAGSRIAICSKSPGNAWRCRMRGCGGAATSIISGATRAVISSRWSGLSIRDAPLPRRCWRNSVALARLGGTGL